MKEERVLKTAFYNNKFVKASQIKINPNNLAISRGYAAFDFFRVINGRAFYAQRYIDRFINTLKIMRIQIIYSKIELLEIINELIHKNGAGNCFIKIFALPESQLKIDNPSILIIQAMEIAEPSMEAYSTGSNLLLKAYQRFLPNAKSTNYVPSVYWNDEMEIRKAIDILYCFDNKIYECSRANIFLIKNSEIYTPSEKILYGITKSIIADIIRSKGMVYNEKNISVDELWEADEIFITSTIKQIMPIIIIDGKEIGNGKPGNKTMELIKLFNIHLVSQGNALVAKN